MQNDFYKKDYEGKTTEEIAHLLMDYMKRGVTYLYSDKEKHGVTFQVLRFLGEMSRATIRALDHCYHTTEDESIKYVVAEELDLIRDCIEP